MSTVNSPKSRTGAEFFQQPATAAHRQYEALRAYFVEGLPAVAVAEQFGYTTAAFYALCRDFRAQRLAFFRAPGKPGPKQAPKRAAARERVVQLRKQNYSALRPPLTVIAQPVYEMGVIAARLLLGRIQAPDGPIQHVTLETRLILRASCGRPQV